MDKEEYIARYGEEAYKKKVARKNELNAIWMKKWRKEHPKEAKTRAIRWKQNHPVEIKAHDNEISRKGGKYYEAAKRRGSLGIPNEKRKIRGFHRWKYRDYKKIVAPDSQLHHNWLNDGTAAYSGVALVEADQHMHGFIDVIEILEGDVAFFTEASLQGCEEATEW